MAALGVMLAVVGGVIAAFSGASSGDWAVFGLGAGIVGLALLIWDRAEDADSPV